MFIRVDEALYKKGQKYQSFTFSKDLTQLGDDGLKADVEASSTDILILYKWREINRYISSRNVWEENTRF